MLNCEMKQRNFSTTWPSVFEYLDFECFVLTGKSIVHVEKAYNKSFRLKDDVFDACHYAVDFDGDLVFYNVQAMRAFDVLSVYS